MSDCRIESLHEIDMSNPEPQYITHCPNCKSLGKRYDDYKLSISIEKNVYHCYRCGSSGRADQLLAGVVNNGLLLKYRMSTLDNTKKYSTKAGILIQTELIDYDNISTPIDRCFINAVEYLKKRHLTFEEIQKYNIRIGKGLYRGRITIPTYDLQGNVVYMVARDYVNPDPESKYLNPSGSHKSLAIWNIQNVKQGTKIIITEGVFSGIAANRNTPEDTTAISIFGKVLSDNQAKLIASTNPIEVSLCFDGDVAKNEIINNYLTLRKFYTGNVTVTKLNNEEDPDNMNPIEFSTRYENRKSYKDFLMTHITKLK